MSELPKDVPPAENSWPPPPTLPPPQPVPMRGLFLRLPIWSVALIDMGLGLAEAGFSCLRRWLGHHAVHWAEEGAGGLILFLTFLTVHLWMRSVGLGRERKEQRERKGTEQAQENPHSVQ